MLGWGKGRKEAGRERREPGFDDPRGEILRAEPDDRVSGGRRRKASGDGRREPRLDDRDDLRADPRENSLARGKCNRQDDKGARRRKRRRRSGSVVGGLVYWTLVLGVWSTIGLAALFAYHASRLPPSRKSN